MCHMNLNKGTVAHPDNSSGARCRSDTHPNSERTLKNLTCSWKSAHLAIPHPLSTRVDADVRIHLHFVASENEVD